MPLIKAAAAMLAVLALAIAPPWALIRSVGNPWPEGGVSLSAPLTDQAVIGLLTVVVWLLWAQLVACILSEIVAAVTDDRVRVRVPLAPGLFEHLARRLVTAIVVVGISAPVAAIVAASPAPGAEAARATPLSLVPSSSEPATASAVPSAPPASRPSTATVTVMRLDDLWSIAERHLGDGERWQEIYDLNRDRVMNDGSRFVDPARIRPGWELLVPSTESSAAAGNGGRLVVVKQGDTLSKIASDELGDPDAYPRIFDASKDLAQPGGARLTDPDLLLPGWKVQMPVQPAPAESAAQERTVPVPPRPSAPIDRDTDLPAPTIASPEPESAEPSTQDPGDGLTALRALLATSVCLSAGALALLITHRRRQLRHRQPGRVVARTPARLVEVEKTITASGREAVPDVEFLDRATRKLALDCRNIGAPVPDVDLVVLGKDGLELRFGTAPVTSPPPAWTASDDGKAWSLPRDTDFNDAVGEQPAPYPALVSVGTDDDGRTWLLDLEEIGSVGISGDAEATDRVARYVVAELGVNAWSYGSRVLLADGFAEEMVGLNPARLECSDGAEAVRHAATIAVEADLAAVNTGDDILARRRDGQLLDSSAPVVVVLPQRVPDGLVADVANLLAGPRRTRVVLVHRTSTSPTIEVKGEGRIVLPRWGQELNAPSLTANDAAAMADLATAAREIADEEPPDVTKGPLIGFAKANGAMSEAYVAPRRTDEHDELSMLSEPDAVYVETAATTPTNLETMAPSIRGDAEPELVAVDEQLDNDITDWSDPKCNRPKVHLLGPVNVVALGGTRQGLPSVPVAIEMTICLACRERDMTADQLADAMGWGNPRTVQNRAGDVRKLLGRKADGSEWLPDANTTSSAERGVPSYELDTGPGGVLVDADLVVRLRARAQRKGGAGIDDLVTALSLVKGRPFDRLRPRGYGWLLEGHRYDHMLVATIEDIAHLVATRANSEGRTDLVRLACDAARRANPDSPIAWLDEAAAEQTDRGVEAAEKVVRERVIDVDDEDPPERVEDVLRQRRWLAG